MRSMVDRKSQGLDIGAVIVCAGKGERTGLPYNKVLHFIGQKTVIEHVLDVFSDTSVTRSVIVASKADMPKITELADRYENVSICVGGATRAESVKNGLAALGACDIVVIHDGARPFVTTDIIENSVASAAENGSGIAAVRAVDTIKRVSENSILAHLDRSELYCMQTPQTFRYDEICAAYAELGDGAYTCTDDAEIYGKSGKTPKIVDGDYSNIKITTANDLVRALPRNMRIGAGFDVHRLANGRKLILGGIDVPNDKGLDGHSDADVLTHAIMDAMLSAAELPDIGVLFPDTDDRFLGISSMKLLADVMERVTKSGRSIVNISAVIIAQRPKLAPFISSIRASLANAIGVDISQINVSATTTEHIGIVGSGEAIAASASCLLGVL